MHLSHVVRGGLVVFCAVLFGLATAPTAFAAEPVLRVRGRAEIDLAAGWLDGHLIVSGSARDDTGRPLAGAELSLVARGSLGKSMALGAGVPCSPLAEADKVPRGSPDERSLRTDRAGRFCVDFEGEAPVDVEIRYRDARGLLDPAARRVTVERNRRGVELRFVDPPSSLDLDAPATRVEVGMRSEPPVASPTTLPIVLFVRAAEKERLLAQLPCRLGATAVFSIPSAELGAPGPVELVVRFAGTESFQPAETARRLPSTAKVMLSVGRRPEGDPESGIPVDLAIGSSRGAVGTGSVEARLGGETVGIAKVDNGIARVVARFARRPMKTVELTLHYLPSEPWWTPSPPLRVEATLAPRSHWASIAWLLGLIGIAAWLLKSWQRPARTLRATTASGLPKVRAAAVVVVEKDEAALGWRGIVRDAHDETPVRDALVSIMANEAEGPRAVARATTGDDGLFELPDVTTSSEARFVVTARWHAVLTVQLPPHGRLEVDLVTRRRQLVARFVAWATREGHAAKGQAEPTPGDVRLAAHRVRRPDVVEWADAVEGAAYGPDPVDEPVERRVLDREPPERPRPPREEDEANR